MNRWDRLRHAIARQYYQVRKALLHRRIGHRWKEGDGLERRWYPDYATYVEHQKTKFGALKARGIERHDRLFYAALTERLATLDVELRGRSVLCLAARQGTEVRAFIDRGAFAVGIDLNPGRASRHVLTGDFHDLQFADASVDLVYTNSLDHAFDLDRLLAEVRRVLKPGASFLVEANVDADDGGANSGSFESLVWEGADALLGALERSGFELASRARFEVPWRGEQLVLRRATEAGGS